MAIAVVSPTAHGKLQTHFYTFGYANLASGARVTDTTQFEIGSETKLFTAALLAYAVKHSIVRETEPIQKPLVSSGVTVPTDTAKGACSRAITFVDLATHNSGLPRVASNFPLHGTPAERAAYSPKQLYHALEKAKLKFCPRHGWRYSNFAFGVLGTILSQKEGPSYSDLIDSQITSPLAMPETTLETETPELATGYLRECTSGTPGCPTVPPHCPCFAHNQAAGVPSRAATQRPLGVPGAPFDDDGAYAGAGGLVSSLSDMATFIRAQLGVGPSWVVHILQMTQKRVAKAHGYKHGLKMGLAWQDYLRNGVNYLSKDGSTPSMNSGTVLLPGPRIGVTVLSNGPSGDISVAQRIIQKLFAISPP
jgi:CubicO group peptidase (beta-lactamase class C family)